MAKKTKILFSLAKKNKSEFWNRVAKHRALRLFHLASKRVPAYKEFLKKNNITPEKIKSWSDFQQVPPVNKKNYLRLYPFEKLHWDGVLNRPLILTSTSGSTGQPAYFSRGRALDKQYASVLNKYLQEGSYPNGPILIVICFGMGVWIGGLITYQSYEIASRSSNLPVSIITPGINKTEIIKILRNLGPHYKQIILVGYPPFIKEIIDDARAEKVALSAMNIRFHFAAEAISEKFRDYISSSSKANDLYRDTINIYGSADIGAMAYEDAASILVKRLALSNHDLFVSLFDDIQKTPTLAQYDPKSIHFESDNGNIMLTGDNSMPLVRYAIGDKGGVLTFKELESHLLSHKISIWKEAKKRNIHTLLNELPFVYVYERSDFSTTLYGINIYPEVIREALLDKKIQKDISGKFSMSTEFDKKQNQFLHLNIEMRKNVPLKQTKKKKVFNLLEKYLLSKSSEFRELKQHLKNRKFIKVIFWPSSHPLYFKPGVKQKWVINKV